MSGYTAIEADVPNTPPTQSQNGFNQNQNHLPEQSQPISNNPNEWTWAQKLKQSSHPMALLVFMILRVFPIFVYLFGNFFIGFVTKKNRFILHFIILILLVAADFWNLKNISGRLLVGLRWWNEINLIKQSTGEFENVWVFETADPNRYINPIDSNMFWILLYAQPIAWGFLGILAILKFEFLYLILIVITVSLSLTNAVAFTRCDKFGKANDMANNLFSQATGSIFSRLNPFA